MVVIEEKVEAIFPLQTKNINNVKPKSKKSQPRAQNAS